LPAGGAFIGGLVAYSKTLRGIAKEEIAKVARWKWSHLPEAMHAVPGAKYVTNLLH
jgi:hypothetical protein